MKRVIAIMGWVVLCQNVSAGVNGPTFKGALKAYGAGGNGPLPPQIPPDATPVTSLHQLCANLAKPLFVPQPQDTYSSSRKGARAASPGGASHSQLTSPTVSKGPVAHAVTLVSPELGSNRGSNGGRFLIQPGQNSHHELPVNTKPGQAVRQQDDVSLLYRQSDLSISLPPMTASAEVRGNKSALNLGDPLVVRLSNGAVSIGQYIGRLEGQYVDDQGKQISGVYISTPNFHGQLIVPSNRITFTQNGRSFQPQLMNPLPTVAVQEGTRCATHQMLNSAEVMCLRGVQNGLTRLIKGIAPGDNPELYQYLQKVASSPEVMDSIDHQLGSQQRAYRQAGILSYRTHDTEKALEHVEKGDIFGMPGILLFDFTSAESVPVPGSNRTRTSYDQRKKPDRTIVLDSDRTRIEADMTYLPMAVRPNTGADPSDKRTFNGHAVLVAEAYRNLQGRMIYVVLDSNKAAPREFYREDFIRQYMGVQPADYILLNPRPDLVMRPEPVPALFGGAPAPRRGEGWARRQEIYKAVHDYMASWRNTPEQAPRVLAQSLLQIVDRRLRRVGQP